MYTCHIYTHIVDKHITCGMQLTEGMAAASASPTLSISRSASHSSQASNLRGPAHRPVFWSFSLCFTKRCFTCARRAMRAFLLSLSAAFCTSPVRRGRFLGLGTVSGEAEPASLSSGPIVCRWLAICTRNLYGRQRSGQKNLGSAWGDNSGLGNRVWVDISQRLPLCSLTGTL